MSSFNVPYKMGDDDSLIEEKDKPITQRKSHKAISSMTSKFLDEITMLKMADDELGVELEDMEDYGGSTNQRLFMDKLMHSVVKDEKPDWLMSCTYMEPKTKSELGVNIPMGKYEQQFTQDLIRSPFWRDLPSEKQDQIL